jgi:hypothetical protein
LKPYLLPLAVAQKIPAEINKSKNKADTSLKEALQLRQGLPAAGFGMQ